MAGRFTGALQKLRQVSAADSAALLSVEYLPENSANEEFVCLIETTGAITVRPIFILNGNTETKEFERAQQELVITAAGNHIAAFQAFPGMRASLKVISISGTASIRAAYQTAQ